MEDVEPFIEWLRGQGLPAEQVAAYRAHLDELAKHPSLSAAIRAAEEAGTPPRQIANMRQAAGRFVEFKETRGQAVRGTPPAPVVAKPAAAATFAAAPAPTLDVEARTPAVARALRREEPPRLGCTCKKRYDLYLDNDFGALARMLGGGIGIGTLILIRLVGLLGAAAIALGLAGMGGLVTIFSVCFRCEGCRLRISALDEDERAHLRKARGMVVLVTAGLIAGAVLCGYLWFILIRQNVHRHY